MAFLGLEKKIIVHDLRAETVKEYATNYGVARVVIGDGGLGYVDNTINEYYGYAHLINLQTGEERALGQMGKSMEVDETGKTIIVQSTEWDYAFSLPDGQELYKSKVSFILENSRKKATWKEELRDMETGVLFREIKGAVDIPYSNWEINSLAFTKEDTYSIFYWDRGIFVYDHREKRITYVLEGFSAFNLAHRGGDRFWVYCSWNGYVATLDLSGVV